MNTVERTPRIVRWTLRLEGATALDRPVKSLEPVVEILFGGGTRGSVLRGEWLGHSVHPVLTDVLDGVGQGPHNDGHLWFDRQLG